MPTGQCITVVKAGAAMGVGVFLSQRCRPRPGRCGRSGIPRIPPTRLTPLLQGDGCFCGSGASRVRVDAVVQVYRVYRRRGLRRCYRGTGVSVAAVQAASGVDAVVQVYRVYRRRGLRRCYKGRVFLWQRCKPRPGSMRSFRYTAYTVDAACAAATGDGCFCSSGASRVRVDAVVRVHRVYRRRGLRRCYRGRVFLWQRCEPRQDSTRQDVSRDTAPKTRARL